MKKNLLLKFGLIVFSLGLSYPLYTSATMFHLTGLEDIYALSPDRVLDNMTYVHFADNGNDFGGFLFFFNKLGDGEFEDTTTLPRVATNSSDTSIYQCKNQVKGFYYNAERGERLWPLDSETWSEIYTAQGLETTGGIYTTCVQSGYEEALLQCEKEESESDYKVCTEEARQKFKADGHGYYGSVVQTYSGKVHTLTMGVDYDTSAGTNFIPIKSGSDLSPTFVRINNKYPVGFVYDNLGGVGLAGCKLKTGNLMGSLVDEAQIKGLSEIFEYSPSSGHLVYTGSYIQREYVSCENISLADKLMKIVIEGIVGINGNGQEGATKFGALGNLTDTKMQYFATQSVSNTTMMNYARRKAELLCRGKWINSNINLNSDKIICWDGGKVETGSSEWAKNAGKTLIVKNADVVINPITDENDTHHHDIFIMSGDLLIDETDAQKFVFDGSGFITNIGMSNDDVNGETVVVSPIDVFRMWIIDINHGIERPVMNAEVVNYLLCSLEEECTIEPYYDANGDGIVDRTDHNYRSVYCLGRSSYNFGPVNSIASLIKGNFIINGNVKPVNGDTLNNKYFIHGKFTTKDTFGSLEDVFAWRCYNEWGSDGNYCPKSGPYRNASLVVIDQNYSSPLLQS